MIEIIPTVVPHTFEDVERAAERAALLGASALHIDITDGVFAPSTTWLPDGERLTPRDGFIYEAHLMVSLPKEVGLACIRAGMRRIIGHIEAMDGKAEAIFRDWRAAGAEEVGLGVLFATPLPELLPHIAGCDVVQMMSIGTIGVQGIPYEPGAPARIAELHAAFPQLLIADDGGVSEGNIAELARAGVSRFCIGSALSRAGDPSAAYARLLSLAENAVQ